MVTKNELQKKEAKLEHLLGQRRAHQDELVTAQVELRHASGDLTRLLAEGVLSGRRDEASVAEAEKRAGELKGQARGLGAALALERGIIAEAQAQVEQAGREWAAGRGRELVRQATENRHKLEEVRQTLVGIFGEARSLMDEAAGLQAAYGTPLAFERAGGFHETLENVKDVWKRSIAESLDHLEALGKADLTGTPPLRPDEPHEHRYVRGRTAAGVQILTCDVCGVQRERRWSPEERRAVG